MGFISRDPLRYLDVERPLPSELPQRCKRWTPPPFLGVAILMVSASFLIALLHVYNAQHRKFKPVAIFGQEDGPALPTAPPTPLLTKKPTHHDHKPQEPQDETTTVDSTPAPSLLDPPLHVLDDCTKGSCGICEGECDSDKDCADDLLCFQRKDGSPIPGCSGVGVNGQDYCFRYSGEMPLLQMRGECTADKPCGRCQGDCDDDSQCEVGLTCWHREEFEAIPGCGGFGVSGKDYCMDPVYGSETVPEDSVETTTVPPAPDGVTYIPGDLTVKENGLLLSTGLKSRIVATSGQPVQYADGSVSAIPFHPLPDGAAVFETDDGGWIYASNAESKHGGVGAIRFNKNGQVVNYEMVAQHSQYNCGGGPTWWNSWITCEEMEGGHIWEVDPYGNRIDRMTIMGGDMGGRFEAATYYRPNATHPTFYVTEDIVDGALRRFTPDAMAVKVANQRNDFSELLHSNATGTAKIEYLKLIPVTDNWGTFHWTTDEAAARVDAEKYYSFSEGIDCARGVLYVTAKEPKILLSLDLEHGTYERSSTKTGAFDEKPDQIQYILGDSAEEDILYFCEDGFENPNSGIHGRDSSGRFYSVIDAPDIKSEATGLAFSPDNMHMYVSYQKDPGTIFDIERRDGFPFGGARLDIKYHEVTS